MKLSRVAIGPLRLANLKPGESRILNRAEVEELYNAAQKRRKQSTRRSSQTPAPISGRPDRAPRHRDEPIIDRSLPAEAFDDDIMELVAGNYVGAIEANQKLGAALAEQQRDREFASLEDSDDASAAPINLAPIGASRPRPSRTIIGGNSVSGHSPAQRKSKGRRRSHTGKAQGRNRKRR
jgi:hypothetical protein